MTAAALATTLTATTTLAAAAPAALTAAPATLTATRGAGAERGVAFPGTLSREAEIIDLVHASLRVVHPDQPAFFGPGHIVRFQQRCHHPLEREVVHIEGHCAGDVFIGHDIQVVGSSE